jgi:hypothetical protein
MIYTKIENEYGVNLNELSARWGLEDTIILEKEYLINDHQS